MLSVLKFGVISSLYKQYSSLTVPSWCIKVIIIPLATPLQWGTGDFPQQLLKAEIKSFLAQP